MDGAGLAGGPSVRRALVACGRHPGDADRISPSRSARGGRGELGIEVSVDQDQNALPAGHPLHRRDRLHDAVGCPAVMSEITSTRSALTWVGPFLDNDGAVEAAEDLVGGQAVVVRVVPERSCRVVGRDQVVVVERFAGVDRHERVVAVALRGDLQPVGVQVGRLVEVVDQVDTEVVTLPQAQGRSGDPTVVRSVVASRPASCPRCCAACRVRTNAPAVLVRNRWFGEVFTRSGVVPGGAGPGQTRRRRR